MLRAEKGGGKKELEENRPVNSKASYPERREERDSVTSFILPASL